MTVCCITDTCERVGEPIDNPFEYPPEVIRCGTCGGPVQEMTSEPKEPER